MIEYFLVDMTTASVRKRVRAVMVCVCLLALVLLVWRLAGGGFYPSRLFSTTDGSDDAPVLDSFSEPSLALAVLQQEAERLMLPDSQIGIRMQGSRSVPLHDSSAPGKTLGLGSVSGSEVGSDSPAASKVSAAAPLAKLRSGVQKLEIDLDRKLLVAFYQHQSWSEFVDCYLRLVQLVPEGYGVPEWEMHALECAQKCGRAEEVADALWHLVRFHPNLPGVQRLRPMLEQWKPPPKVPLINKQ